VGFDVVAAVFHRSQVAWDATLCPWVCISGLVEDFVLLAFQNERTTVLQNVLDPIIQKDITFPS